ncbi:iron ABC transporter permease [Archaeoglobales archaeon ex4484_92]|nr:MAG: iron ABC transporter permease [Archaeoglobales archaeon ex4484_92]
MKKLILALIILNILSVFLGLSIGSAINPAESLYGLVHGKETIKSLILNYRLPRTLTAMLVGASLSIAGCTMQAFFRNPLADPYILGVSSGASVGAALAILLGIATTYNLIFMAFITSIATATLVYKLGKSAIIGESYGILLAGIAVASFLSGLTAILIYMAGESMHKVVFWILGSFSNSKWEKFLFSAPISCICIAYILFNSWKLNAILLGDEHAISVGLNVSRFRKRLVTVISLLTSSAVAISGVIGFVGIIIPHTMRLIVGESHQRLLITTLFLGSAFMPIVDIIARSSISGELPIGALTALIGAPFFVYLLRRGV